MRNGWGSEDISVMIWLKGDIFGKVRIVFMEKIFWKLQTFLEEWRHFWKQKHFGMWGRFLESEDILGYEDFFCPFLTLVQIWFMLRLVPREWVMCVTVVLVTVVLGFESSSPSKLSFFGFSSWRLLITYWKLFHSADSLHKKSKRVKTFSNHNRCFKDKAASEIFYQLAATFNKSLFTGMLSICLLGVLSLYSVWPLVSVHSCIVFISNPVILIKIDLENNQISFM